MQQTARSRRRAERAIAEGRTPGKPGPKAKHTEEEFREVIKARNKAYREAHREEIRRKSKESYDLRHAVTVLIPKKRGRPLKYRTPEEVREAERAKTARYVERNKEKCRAASRDASKQRKAVKAIADGRTPGLVGNPKRFATEAERKIAVEAKRQRYYQRQGLDAVRRYWVKARNIRRARITGVGGTYTVADIDRLFDLQKGKCVFCLKPLNKTSFHIDHHEPLSRGGSNNKSNLRLMHQRCNLLKGARDPAEHALKHGLLCW